MTNEFAMSIENAPINGTTINAVRDGPYSFITAASQVRLIKLNAINTTHNEITTTCAISSKNVGTSHSAAR